MRCYNESLNEFENCARANKSIRTSNTRQNADKFNGANVIISVFSALFLFFILEHCVRAYAQYRRLYYRTNSPMNMSTRLRIHERFDRVNEKRQHKTTQSI